MREINSFILYYDWYLLLKNLSFEEKGILFEAIFLYVSGSDQFDKLTLPALVKSVLDYLVIYLDRDKTKYIERCKKNEENIKKRYEKRQEALKNAKNDKKQDYAGYDLDAFNEQLENI